MSQKFIAFLYRMKHIERWALMRNTQKENIAEHSYYVAVLAHTLGVIRRDVFGVPCEPERFALCALYHDISEILTGDMPTPIKYFNPAIRDAYHQVEKISNEKLVSHLPEEMRHEWEGLLNEDGEAKNIVHAADKLSAYLKCVEEVFAGNREFQCAKDQTEAALKDMHMPEVDYFLREFAPALELTLDEME